MRPLYLFLRVTLPYAFSIFFKRRETLNAQKKFNAQTIIISNHPSAFIDPIVLANFQRPIVYFMTRSDVFKPWLKPITWACHMVPIYRADQDGAGTYKKNQKVFKGIQGVLKRKKSLILFGEGYTDDVFIRSLKPMKKGGPRIGISSMEAFNWEEDIKVQPIGLNYTEPSTFRSDILMSCGEVIHLKDYKKLYDENPNKAVTVLMREVGKGIQENITYVRDRKKAPFHEQIMQLTRKGMNHENYDSKYSLVERFRYSQNLARRINEEFTDDNTSWNELKSQTESYFKQLKSKKAREADIHRFVKNGGKKLAILHWLYLFITLPLFLASCVHNLAPYLITKGIVENVFRRRVFWSGVKIVLGGLIWLLCNLPIFWLFPEYVYDSVGLALIYFFTVPAITFLFFHHWIRTFKANLRYSKLSKSVLSGFAKKREELLDQIKKMNLDQSKSL